MANQSVAPSSQGIPSFQTPPVDPQSTALLASQQRLQAQTTAGDIVTTDIEAKNQALSTAGSVRQSISSTLHGLKEQAVTISQQMIGDEIAQAKKGVENSGKAV